VLVSRDGGSPRVLGRIPDGGDGRRVAAGAVSPTGSAAALVRRSDDGTQARLYLVDLVSGDEVAIDASIRRAVGPGQLAWSPDGRWLFAASDQGRLLAVDAR